MVGAGKESEWKNEKEGGEREARTVYGRAVAKVYLLAGCAGRANGRPGGRARELA